MPSAGTAAGEAGGGGDEEAAADDLEQQLEAAAPAGVAEDAGPEDESASSGASESAPAGDGEPAAGLERAPEVAALESPGGSSVPAAGGGTDVSREEGAVPPEVPATGPESVGPGEEGSAATDAFTEVETDDADVGVEEGAVDAEPAELSPAEKDVAMAAMAEGGGGEPAGGGGGGGSAVPDRQPPQTPEVSTLDPAAALAKAGSAPPAQLAVALGGVKAAVGQHVGQQRQDLASNPPAVERPAGKGSKDVEGPSGTAAADRVDKAREGREKPTPQPEPLPEPPAPPVDAVSEPSVRTTAEGELTEEGARRIKGSISELPTSDPALHATAGPAPRVQLEGNADPALVEEQRGKLQQTVDTTAAQGRADAAAYMGEDDIHDDQPAQTLTASIGGEGGPAAAGGGGGGAAGGAGAGVGAEGPNAEAASIIAQEEKGSDIARAVADAKAEMAAKRDEHVAQVADEKAKSKEDIATLEQDNVEEQDAVRKAAKQEVAKKRGAWTSEQETAVKEAGRKAKAEVETGQKKVEDKKREADDTARDEIRKGNAEAERERLKAEREAAQKKREAKKESSGLLGWLASKAKAFFNKIKAAIKKAFEVARRLVKAAIQKAKELAAKAIEAARKAIVAAIKAVGDALIAIGDRLLKHFPALREKFRKAIKSAVDKAVTTVNKLAERLNAAIQRALDALGSALDAALGLLEKGLLAAVDAVGSAVEGALKFANSVIQALAAFAALVKDVASGPLQWLKNLGAAVVDGIRNHLWKAFKSAVQEWFNAKVQEVLGLGTAIWNMLIQGGLTVAQIGKMAWEGIKALIPMAVIQILVEKLVSMIVPAAGAVKVIIEGLQAAWGAVGRILQAFSKFFAFLKAVKSGNAGPKFAEALAAAAVAVIDFIANWLLLKLAKGARKVGGKLKGIARRLKAKKRAKAARKKAKTARSKARPRPKRRRSTTRPPAAKPGGRRRKRKDRDEKDARRRVARADRYVARVLARGLDDERDLHRLAGTARRKFRLRRADVTISGRVARFVLTANPTEREVAQASVRADRYRARAEKYLQWLLKYHHIHHIYPKERTFAKWWEALGIDHHHPTNMLEIPLLLHQQGVHKGFKKLRPDLTLREHKLLMKKTDYEWNAAWKVWKQIEMGREGIVSASDIQKDSTRRDRMRVRAENMASGLLKTWSRKLGVDLSAFRVGGSGPDSYRSRYGTELRELLKVLEDKKADPRKVRERVNAFAGEKVRELREIWKRERGG